MSDEPERQYIRYTIPDASGGVKVVMLMNRALEEGGRWVTINGAHIFIDDGESPESALADLKSGKRSYSGSWTTKSGIKMQYDAKESLSDTTPNVDGDKGTPTFEHIFSSSGTVTFEHPQLGKIHSDSPIQIKKISTGDEGIEFIGSHAKGSTKVETIPPPEVMDKIKTYQGRKSRSEIATYKIEKAARDKSYEIDRERRYREKIHSGALPGNFPYEKFK